MDDGRRYNTLSFYSLPVRSESGPTGRKKSMAPIGGSSFPMDVLNLRGFPGRVLLC